MWAAVQTPCTRQHRTQHPFPMFTDPGVCEEMVAGMQDRPPTSDKAFDNGLRRFDLIQRHRAFWQNAEAQHAAQRASLGQLVVEATEFLVLVPASDWHAQVCQTLGDGLVPAAAKGRSHVPTGMPRNHMCRAAQARAVGRCVDQVSVKADLLGRGHLLVVLLRCSLQCRNGSWVIHVLLAAVVGPESVLARVGQGTSLGAVGIKGSVLHRGNETQG